MKNHETKAKQNPPTPQADCGNHFTATYFNVDSSNWFNFNTMDNQLDWIYWKDKLPPHRELRVLCSKSLKESFIGYFDKNYNSFFDSNGSAKPVSHWQELPPPKQ